MAIVKMKRLRLVAMQEDRQELFEKLQRLGCVEISQPDMDLSGDDVPALRSPDSAQLSQARERRTAAAQALETLKAHSTAKESLLAPRPVISETDLFSQGNLEKGWNTITQVNTTKQEIIALEQESASIEDKRLALEPWKTLDVPLDFAATKGVTVAFGTFPGDGDFTQIQGKITAASPLVDLNLASTGREGHYVMAVCYTPVLDQVMEAMKEAGWSRANLRDYSGTAQENINALESRKAEIAQTIVSRGETLAKMGDQMAIVKQFMDSTDQTIACEEAKGRVLDTEVAFYLDGWVEADRLAEVESMLGGYTVGYQVEDPKEEDIPVVPVKLKNGKLSRSLSIVTEMYSLPAYNGVDPNPLMAPFFVFFYGMMMADMGYGILMILATQFMLSKAKPKGGLRDFCELFRMLGYSTFAWGALTAGFFGNFVENFLLVLDRSSTFTWFWPGLVDPMNQSIQILIVAMAFGAVHLIVGMIVSFCKKTKDGHFADALMDEGSWWLLFAGAGMGVAGMGWVVCYAGVAAIVLTQGRHGKGAMKLVGGIAKLYDITGYFGDILSYARLMALMLAGSVIASVFNDLGMIVADGMGGGVVGLIPYLIIAFLGNALNFLLNLLGCFVHTLRLQCLEFFGKFYMDGGKAFNPLDLNTNFVDLSEQKVS